jgi:hypothetical protein
MSDTLPTAATAVSSNTTQQQQQPQQQQQLQHGDESGPYVLRKLDLDIALSEDGTRDDIHITCVDFWGEFDPADHDNRY